MLLVLDNFDSFTYNLVQYCLELGADVVVRRNDVSIEALKSLRPDALLVSPGPCTPDEAGCSVAAIQYFSGRIPVLGVCLGHQALGQAFGGRVVRAPELFHGRTSLIAHDGDPLFRDVPSPFVATRYHSLIVDRESLPSEFTIIATCGDLIMGLRHRPTGALGIQFHPESILTEHGKTILRNFLAMAPVRV
ncbi:glutamine amidotransferase [Alicyclobacillus cellulosilyticus]|uniref:Glutamine amidotransferase n=1 Tax=Alicyclobacillus cellulosilyticus TaxID=1003997 RepID=A0A917K9S4_9BACL|nr:aminodeoxychorismate/anthranilate synthase component II [Alicyclobacillus cellulosilyticus]GGJ03004.1 glutamine amidotransferase [Alicyclobacillus cellulosilyticus]